MTRLAAAVLIVVAAAALGGQVPSVPTFQSQVAYVELVVSVVGADGAFVPGLAKDDFEVFEDGEGQTIESLSIVDLASETAAAGAASPLAEPDVRSNERPFTGRVWVLALDAYNTAFDRSIQVQQIARLFVERVMGPDDLMTIVTLGEASGAHQDLTNNRRLLLDSIGGFGGERLSSMAVPIAIAKPATVLTGPLPVAPNADTPLVGSIELERQQNALQVLRKLRTVADWAASVRGRRKGLVWLSEGIQYDVTTLFDSPADGSGLGASAINLMMRDTAGVISRADVSIYAIDTAGLTVESAVQDFGRWLGQSNLRAMAESTGGFALANSNNFGAAFDRIVRENSAYYLLTYVPAEARQFDGKYHRIRVRVKRPGVTARTRDGYLAPRDRLAAQPALVPIEGLSPELRSVLQSPIPVSGLPLRVSAVPFKGEGANASVLIAGEIPGRALVSGGDVRLQVSYAAIDAAPAVRASATLAADLEAGSPARMQAEQGGLGFQRRIVLAPGRYQLRVGARDAGRGLAGSVLYDLEVPDYTAGVLAMSGLVLAVPGAPPRPTLSPDESLQAQLGAPPTVQRRFSRRDREAIAYTEVYDRDGAGRDLDLAVTLRTWDGTTVFEDSDRRGAQDARIDGGTHRYSVQIPLEDVPPGEYTLTVSASSRGAGGGTVARAVAITIAE